MVRSVQGRKAAILMYHGVTKEPLSVWNWAHIDLPTFEAHMAYLAREYALLSVEELVSRLSSGRALPEHCAAVTFDDGFKSVATNAYPVLARHKIPFTVFLVTGLIGTTLPPWPERLFNAIARTPCPSVEYEGKEWSLATDVARAAAFEAIVAHMKSTAVAEKDRRLDGLLARLGMPAEVSPDSPFVLMDWDDVAALGRGGLATFGAHTHTHQILSRCSPQTQHDELQRSRDLLVERAGRADLFAYPNGTRGDFTEETKSLVKDLGYACALATIPGLVSPGDDVYELRRVGIGARTSLSAFKVRLCGV